MSNLPPSPRDHRANSPAWIGFAALCVAILLGSVFYASTYGIPGSQGGTSDKQQQSSHAPPPAGDATYGNAGTRETTGYGAPAKPRQ